jgi:hypothetical protein
MTTTKENANMTTNLFEYATRQKLRFKAPMGEISVEQLWELPLRSSSGVHLDAVAKAANKALKDAAEESFVDTAKTDVHLRLEKTLEVVKYVIETKKAEEAAAKKRAENKLERETLYAALAEKQAGKLSAMTEKELQKRIAALEE